MSLMYAKFKSFLNCLEQESMSIYNNDMLNLGFT